MNRNKSTFISTSRDQSLKLLSIGIDPRTADMVWHHTNYVHANNELNWTLETHPPVLKEEFLKGLSLDKNRKILNILKNSDGTTMTNDQVFDKLWGADIPAWSLDSLFHLLPTSIKVYDDNECEYVNAYLDLNIYDHQFSIYISYKPSNKQHAYVESINKNWYGAIIDVLEMLKHPDIKIE